MTITSVYYWNSADRIAQKNVWVFWYMCELKYASVEYNSKAWSIAGRASMYNATYV